MLSLSSIALLLLSLSILSMLCDYTRPILLNDYDYQNIAFISCIFLITTKETLTSIDIRWNFYSGMYITRNSYLTYNWQYLSEFCVVNVHTSHIFGLFTFFIQAPLMSVCRRNAHMAYKIQILVSIMTLYEPFQVVDM